MCNHLIEYFSKHPMGTPFYFDEFCTKFLDTCNGHEERLPPEELFLKLYGCSHIQDLADDALAQKCRVKFKQVQDHFLQQQGSGTVISIKQRILMRDYLYMHECPVEITKKYKLIEDPYWKAFSELLQEEHDTHTKTLYTCLGFNEEEKLFDRKSLVKFEIWCWKGLALVRKDAEGKKRHLSWIDLILEWSENNQGRSKIAIRLFNLFVLYRIKSILKRQLPEVPICVAVSKEDSQIEPRFSRRSPTPAFLPNELDSFQSFTIEKTIYELRRTYEIPLSDETIEALRAVFSNDSLRTEIFQIIDKLDDALTSKDPFNFANIYQNFSDLLNQRIPSSKYVVLNCLVDKCLLFMIFRSRIRFYNSRDVDLAIIYTLYTLVQTITPYDKKILISELRPANAQDYPQCSFWEYFLKLKGSKRFSNIELLLMLLNLCQYDPPASSLALEKVFTLIDLIEKFINQPLNFMQICGILSGPYLNTDAIKKIESQIEWRSESFEEKRFYIPEVIFHSLTNNRISLRDYLLPQAIATDYPQCFAFREKVLEVIDKYSAFPLDYVDELHQGPKGISHSQRYIESDLLSSVHHWYSENDWYCFESTYFDIREDIRCHTVHATLDIAQTTVDETPVVKQLFTKVIDPLCLNPIPFYSNPEKDDRDPLGNLLCVVENSEGFEAWRAFKSSNTDYNALSKAFCKFFTEVKVPSRGILQKFLQPIIPQQGSKITLKELLLKGDIYSTPTGWSLLPPEHPEAMNPAYSIFREQYHNAVETICNTTKSLESLKEPLHLICENENRTFELNLMSSKKENEAGILSIMKIVNSHIFYSFIIPPSVTKEKQRKLIFAQILLLKYRFYRTTLI